MMNSEQSKLNAIQLSLLSTCWNSSQGSRLLLMGFIGANSLQHDADVLYPLSKDKSYCFCSL